MNNQKKGFTLIELLVVIAIIGILSTIGLVALNGARGKARDTQRISAIRQYALAMQSYGDSNNTYTPSCAFSEAGQVAADCADLQAFFGANYPRDPSVSADCDSGTAGIQYCAMRPDVACTGYAVAACVASGTPYVYTDGDDYTIMYGAASTTDATGYAIGINFETGAGGVTKGVHYLDATGDWK